MTLLKNLRQLKDTTILQGFGICVQEDHTSCESECSLSDAESPDTEWISDDEKDQPTPSPLPLDDQLLSILRTINFNWFASVVEVKMQLPNNSENTLFESLEKFSDQLSVLDVSAEDHLKIAISRKGCFAYEKEKATQESMSDEDD